VVYCSATEGDYSTPLIMSEPTQRQVPLIDIPCLQSDGDYYLTITAWNYMGDGVTLRESGPAAWILVKVVGGVVIDGDLPAVPRSLWLS